MAKPEDTRGKRRAYDLEWQARNQHRYRYLLHRANAKSRGIPFLLTFAEWLTIWLDSGKWDQRGRGVNQYVMARFGDVGPYSAYNVHICTVRQNHSDVVYTPEERKRRSAQVKATKPHLSRAYKSPTAEARRNMSAAQKARYIRETRQHNHDGTFIVTDASRT
jgi:hypothetical protein